MLLILAYKRQTKSAQGFHSAPLDQQIKDIFVLSILGWWAFVRGTKARHRVFTVERGGTFTFWAGATAYFASRKENQ